MADLQLYTKASIYKDGSLLSEEADLTVKRMTGAQVAKTVAKGFAGLSPGAPMIQISVTNAVPATDFEYNPGSNMANLDVVEITVFAAGRTLTSKGFITDDNFSHAVETPSKLSFEFTGQFADWE